MQNDDVTVKVTKQELEVILNLIKKTPIEVGLYPMFVKLVNQYNEIVHNTITVDPLA